MILQESEYGKCPFCKNKKAWLGKKNGQVVSVICDECMYRGYYFEKPKKEKKLK